MKQFLVEDQFEIRSIDADGKHFSRVSRMVCFGERYEMDMVCDFNNEIYPLEAGQKLDVALTLTLNDDGSVDDSKQYNPLLKSKLMDEYEYIMHGKVFKIRQPEKSASKLEVFVSYGGLLMSLKGDPLSLQNIELDSNVYLLMRKKN
jgi:DNA-directed RNA polymerase I, II, and III subunit RPABC3